MIKEKETKYGDLCHPLYLLTLIMHSQQVSFFIYNKLVLFVHHILKSINYASYHNKSSLFQ